MPEPAATLDHVSKAFWRTADRSRSIKESLLKSLRERARRDLLMALNDVSFSVQPGEMIGVIGPNGAGKSTLLKLMSGISQPTAGAIQTRGRVLGLIELGAGFHPELSGEENIRLQGSLYGLGREETKRLMPAILDFAGLRDFAALPVKHYSSGMFVRLGFAIAVHAQPDLLLVDEVLAVGDLEFQERCLEAIGRLRARGMAIVLVTHYPEQTERLCDRVAWLEGGRLQALGAPGGVLARWRADLLERRHAKSQGLLTDEAVATCLFGRFGHGGARIENVRLLNGDGQQRSALSRGETLRIEIDYSAEPGAGPLDCAIVLATEDGLTLSYDRAVHAGLATSPKNGRGQFTLTYPALPLLPGRYGLTISLANPANIYDHFDTLYRLIHFSISPEPGWTTTGALALSAEIH